MGATKRVGELLVKAAAERTGRPFVSVRFGNVLSSRGSVVPRFRRQLAHGGPITVTHPEARRYFMTISEAIQLVLQATILGVRGETFVLDMGEPVRIDDMARDLIELHGLVPQREVQIVYTGLGPGEKLEEELFFAHERPSKTAHESIWVAADPEPHRVDLAGLRATSPDDAEAAVAALRHLVPDYRPARDASLLVDGGRSGLPEV
jgi:FlaA1/EpsC-like NDP-sugar epimerase